MPALSAEGGASPDTSQPGFGARHPNGGCASSTSSGRFEMPSFAPRCESHRGRSHDKFPSRNRSGIRSQSSRWRRCLAALLWPVPVGSATIALLQHDPSAASGGSEQGRGPRPRWIDRSSTRRSRRCQCRALAAWHWRLGGSASLTASIAALQTWQRRTLAGGSTATS